MSTVLVLNYGNPNISRIWIETQQHVLFWWIIILVEFSSYLEARNFFFENLHCEFLPNRTRTFEMSCQRQKNLKNSIEIKCEKIHKERKERYSGLGVQTANIQHSFPLWFFSSFHFCASHLCIFSASNELALCADSMYIWAFKWMNWMDAGHFLLANFIFLCNSTDPSWFLCNIQFFGAEISSYPHHKLYLWIHSRLAFSTQIPSIYFSLFLELIHFSVRVTPSRSVLFFFAALLFIYLNQWTQHCSL